MNLKVLGDWFSSICLPYIKTLISNDICIYKNGFVLLNGIIVHNLEFRSLDFSKFLGYCE